MMDAARQQNIHIKNVAINGKQWHLMKAAEECAELAAAIMQHLTKQGSENAIQSEMADVEIALAHLTIIYGRHYVDWAKASKMYRIERKLAEQEEERDTDIIAADETVGREQK